MIPGKYDTEAMLAIMSWKTARESGPTGLSNPLRASLARAGEAVFDAPVIGSALQGVLSALNHVCNEMAQLSLRPQAIFAEFRQEGYGAIESLEDIARLPLENIDRCVGRLDVKYKGLALAEGVTAGLTGMAGLALDIPSLVLLNLRAIGEYATYYGFDIVSYEERLFALQILCLVTAPAGAAKQLAMAQLRGIIQDTVKQRTWRQLEQHATVKMIRGLAQTLGIRLTKAKLAQTLPLIGAALGGGYNLALTAKVCDAAYHTYRERFLVRRFGARITSITQDRHEAGPVAALGPPESVD
ncbi:EcsC family protein [Martelella alba]|uniref:EcsC family protein n=1 Tax=Martelella alba TaxID=2590451 RepID=A0ABY2SRL9_9HYPH|nr:EcsC family protein [Martelella alba]TKI07510.1 EcsC family protein [Martelella alba]